MLPPHFTAPSPRFALPAVLPPAPVAWHHHRICLRPWPLWRRGGRQFCLLTIAIAIVPANLSSLPACAAAVDASLSVSDLQVCMGVAGATLIAGHHCRAAFAFAAFAFGSGGLGLTVLRVTVGQRVHRSASCLRPAGTGDGGADGQGDGDAGVRQTTPWRVSGRSADATAHGAVGTSRQVLDFVFVQAGYCDALQSL